MIEDDQGAWEERLNRMREAQLAAPDRADTLFKDRVDRIAVAAMCTGCAWILWAWGLVMLTIYLLQ